MSRFSACSDSAQLNKTECLTTRLASSTLPFFFLLSIKHRQRQTPTHTQINTHTHSKNTNGDQMDASAAMQAVTFLLQMHCGTKNEINLLIQINESSRLVDEDNTVFPVLDQRSRCVHCYCQLSIVIITTKIQPETFRENLSQQSTKHVCRFSSLLSSFLQIKPEFLKRCRIALSPIISHIFGFIRNRVTPKIKQRHCCSFKPSVLL